MNSVHTSADAFTRYSGVELRHLRLVFTVAEEGNLSRASERLNLTPSALSHQLKAIEEVAGGPVFHRDGKRMRLTPVGEVFYNAAARVLGTIADAEDRVARLQKGRAGTVRISTHCYTGYHWLPGVMRAFQLENPEADVRVVAEATRRAVEALANREIDIAISSEEPVKSGMLQRPVLKDELRLLVSSGHRLAGKSWVEPADIARECILSYADSEEDSSLCTEILRPAGVWPRKFMNIQLTEAIIELVRAGMGVAALAEWALRPHLEKGDLVSLRITRKGWHRTWNAVTWPKAEAGPLVMSFVEHLARELAPIKGKTNSAA